MIFKKFSLLYRLSFNSLNSICCRCLRTKPVIYLADIAVGLSKETLVCSTQCQQRWLDWKLVDPFLEWPTHLAHSLLWIVGSFTGVGEQDLSAFLYGPLYRLFELPPRMMVGFHEPMSKKQAAIWGALLFFCFYLYFFKSWG